MILRDIKKGPGKFDLMVALFDGKPVTFVIKLSEQMTKTEKVTISSVQAEDGSRQSWNITGYTTSKTFKAYYRTSAAEGRSLGHFIEED